MENCEHKYVHLDTKKTNTRDGHGYTYRRIDTFFCEKCLDEKEIKKEKWVGGYEHYKAPDWY